MKQAIKTAILIGVLASGAAAATVRIKPSVESGPGRISLGKVADVETPYAVKAERLLNITVAHLPKGVSAIEITAEDIRRALQVSGINVSEINLVGATKSGITDPASPVARRRLLEEAGLSYLGQAHPDAHFGFSFNKVDFDIMTVSDPIVMAARPQNVSGPVRFDIAEADNPTQKIGHLYATLSKQIPVVAARRNLPRGRMLGEADLEVKYMDAAAAEDGLMKINDASGHRLAKGMAAGEMLKTTLFEKEIIAHRGDSVSLVAKRKTMTLSLGSARAATSGALGDVILVKRSGSRTKQQARLTGPGRAELVMGDAE